MADLVDPHGTHFSDALPKLQGLAKYAGAHPDVYRRIETVAGVGDRLRVLDLTGAAVRQAIAEGTVWLSLYAGALRERLLSGGSDPLRPARPARNGHVAQSRDVDERGGGMGVPRFSGWRSG